MKITVETEHSTVSLNIPAGDDYDIHEMIDVFKRVALAMTYQEHSWESGILAAAAEIEDEHDRMQRKAETDNGPFAPGTK